MQNLLRITFQGLDSSEALERDIAGHAEHLARQHPRLQRCHAVVDLPHRHQHKGNVFRVRLHLALPERDVLIGQDPSLDHAHEDPYLAVRDAFEAARRRLDHLEGRKRDQRRLSRVGT